VVHCPPIYRIHYPSGIWICPLQSPRQTRTHVTICCTRHYLPSRHPALLPALLRCQTKRLCIFGYLYSILDYTTDREALATRLWSSHPRTWNLIYQYFLINYLHDSKNSANACTIPSASSVNPIARRTHVS